MIKEEWMNICRAEGMTEEEAEYGFSKLQETDFDMPSTPVMRQLLSKTIREYLPEMIKAREK